MNQSVDEVVITRRHLIAHDFQRMMHGHLTQEKIDDIVKQMISLTASDVHHAECSIGGALFYVKISLTVFGTPPYHNFDGQAGGLFGIGVNGSTGAMTAYSFDDLYARGTNFTFTTTPGYTAINFFDDSNNLLGMYQGVGAGILVGSGVGRGSWSPNT